MNRHKAFLSQILAIFFIASGSLFAQNEAAKSFKIFQPQNKRDTILPIFTKGDVFSFQIKSDKTTFEEDEKLGTKANDFSIGVEVKNVEKNQVNLSFIISKSQLSERAFGNLFSVQNTDNQPIELNFSIEKNTKIISLENYHDVSKTLLTALDFLTKNDTRLNDKLFFNQVEKLKFDLKNGDSKLMETAFLDIVFFLEAYNFPITSKAPNNFHRSDYEYFAASKTCISDYKKVSTKEYFNVRYEAKQKTEKDVTLEEFNFRYSVLFDAKHFPKSVGLFSSKKSGKKKTIETWTLSQ